MTRMKLPFCRTKSVILENLCVQIPILLIKQHTFAVVLLPVTVLAVLQILDEEMNEIVNED